MSNNSEGFRLFDGQDPSKKTKFVLTEISTGKVIALIVPNADGRLVVEGSHPNFDGVSLNGLSGVLRTIEGNIVGEAGFLNLKDTPISYDGAAGKFLKVNESQSGLEFTQPPEGGGGSPFNSKCCAFRSGNQSINHVTDTKVQLNAEYYDVDTEFDVGNSIFIAKESGFYHVDAQVNYENISINKLCACMVYHNGGVYRKKIEGNGSTTWLQSSLSFDIELTADDYLELWTWHNGGSGVVLTGTYSGVYMNVHRFG